MTTMQQLMRKTVSSLLLLFCSFLVTAGSDQDAALLLQFKSHIEDQKSHLKSWSNSSISSVCNDWRGVRCDNRSDRVVELDLNSMQLSCDLSTLLLPQSSMPLPEKLTSLSVANNNFTGPIEVLLGQFITSHCAFKSLDLSSNGFIIGNDSTTVLAILSSCSTNLRFLNLSRNQLAGDLPHLDQFPTLTHLDLSHNNFTGPFPELKHDNSLQQLQLSHNLFTALNLTTAGCTNLINLDVSFNRITDSSIISSPCMALKDLNLAANLFSGQELPSISAVAPILERIDASGNGFTGSIDMITVPNTLQLLDLSSNKLILGSNSSRICDQAANLSRLLLFNNSFNRPIPADLFLTCTNLASLDLSLNPGLSGPIPSQLCTRMVNLQELIIAGSNLSGQIPLDLFTHCSNLTVLLLNNNDLTGSIPPQINQLTHLRWLALSNNRLTGTIPGSLQDLRDLAFLELSNNRLEGEIPGNLGLNSTTLIWLDLNSNSLSGPVPAPFGLSGQAITFPVNFLHGGDIVFAMNSPTCQGGLGRLLLVQKKSVEEDIQREFSCKVRLYPISSYNLTARPVTSPVFLDLSFNNLSGELPEAIEKMRDLTMVDLRRNNLTGAIPPAIGKLRLLMLLDLSYNHLVGNLPPELGDLTFLSSLNLSSNNLSGEIPLRGQLTTFSADSYQENPLLCGVLLNKNCSGGGGGTSGYATPHVFAQRLLVALLVCGILILAAAAWWMIRRKKQTTNPKINKNTDAAAESDPSDGEPRRMSYTEIETATQRFRVLIGSGGSADVFKAQLRDGSPAAVKRLSFPLASHEFLGEIENLGKIRHPNLLPLLGFCAHRDDHLLVYPLMIHGNLEQLLAALDSPIPWTLRRRIATDTARGLSYLHHTCVPHIVHRDVKSSNILLDAAWTARLADFGMARLMLDGMSRRSDYVSVTTLWGTPGYVPPEYYQSFLRCTRGGDVYSYGVIVLELLTRKRATGNEFGESNLVGWVRSRISAGREVVDSDLSVSGRETEEALEFLSLAMACVDDRPNKRPTMLQLLARLKELSLNNDG